MTPLAPVLEDDVPDQRTLVPAPLACAGTLDGRDRFARWRGQHGLIPVIAPVATGCDGATYNVNADHVAGMVAAALGAAVLLELTDVPGSSTATAARLTLSTGAASSAWCAGAWS